jgi:2-C-methyl-D-erythritol 4-phosphate cytidylyltransferase
MSAADTAAIIVAGGQGTRFGGKVRKQYLALGKRPLLWWSVAAFDRSPSVAAVWIVAPAEDVARVGALARRWGFRKLKGVVAGGATRRASVREGMRAAGRGQALLAVHDAVRPLIAPAVIEETIAQARKTGAAIAACASKDTVKLATPSGWVAQTPPRERVWLAQTPQVFRRRLLERAHAGSPGLTATDDAQLVERLGARVKLVASPADNLKVTVPADLWVAARVLARRRKTL